MGFQLADDNDSSSSSKRNSPTGTSVADDFSLDTDASKPKQNDWNEGFGPQVNDTVFIANQYQGSRPAATSVSSKASARATNSFPPFLMLISAALNILFMVLVVMQIKGTVADAQSLMTVASSYTFLVVAAEVCLIADAIVMCAKGNGFGLIIWALLLPVVYYFVRCKRNGDSSLIATVIILLMLVAGGVYFFSISSAISGIDVSGPQDINTDPALAEQVNRLPSQTLKYGGREYSYKSVIDANITKPVYSLIPETKDAGKRLSISGTLTTDSSQDIEIQINTSSFTVCQITIGSTTYTTDTEINNALIPLLANTSAN